MLICIRHVQYVSTTPFLKPAVSYSRHLIQPQTPQTRNQYANSQCASTFLRILKFFSNLETSDTQLVTPADLRSGHRLGITTLIYHLKVKCESLFVMASARQGHGYILKHLLITEKLPWWRQILRICKLK